MTIRIPYDDGECTRYTYISATHLGQFQNRFFLATTTGSTSTTTSTSSTTAAAGGAIISSSAGAHDRIRFCFGLCVGSGGVGYGIWDLDFWAWAALYYFCPSTRVSSSSIHRIVCPSTRMLAISHYCLSVVERTSDFNKMSVRRRVCLWFHRIIVCLSTNARLEPHNFFSSVCLTHHYPRSLESSTIAPTMMSIISSNKIDAFDRRISISISLQYHESLWCYGAGIAQSMMSRGEIVANLTFTK